MLHCQNAELFHPLGRVFLTMCQTSMSVGTKSWNAAQTQQHQLDHPHSKWQRGSATRSKGSLSHWKKHWARQQGLSASPQTWSIGNESALQNPIGVPEPWHWRSNSCWDCPVALGSTWSSVHQHLKGSQAPQGVTHLLGQSRRLRRALLQPGTQQAPNIQAQHAV